MNCSPKEYHLPDNSLISFLQYLFSGTKWAAGVPRRRWRCSWGALWVLCVPSCGEMSIRAQNGRQVFPGWAEAMVQLGNISGRNLYFCESSEHFMERNIYGREYTPDEKYMLEALKEARKAAQRDEVPIGAVVVCGGRIIARAHNLTEALSDATAHAEMQAITMAAAAVGGKYLDKCTLYVTVEPCPMCAAALAWSQIKRVVYGASDETRGYSKFTPSLMHPKTEVTGGVLAEECGNVVTDFFRQKR